MPTGGFSFSVHRPPSTTFARTRKMTYACWSYPVLWLTARIPRPSQCNPTLHPPQGEAMRTWFFRSATLVGTFTLAVALLTSESDGQVLQKLGKRLTTPPANDRMPLTPSGRDDPK